MTIILSVSCGHDASVTLLEDGQVAVGIVQERLDRIKHSNATGKPIGPETIDDQFGFPWDAVQYCLEARGIAAYEVDVFTTDFDDELPVIGREQIPFPGHHRCHAALAFFGSQSDSCAVLVMDYAGNTIWLDDAFVGYERESAWFGNKDGIWSVWQHLGANEATLFGLGCIYNQIAAYLFGAPDPEGKLMALAAYGRPNPELGRSFFTHRDGLVFATPSGLFEESADRPPFLPESLPNYMCDLNWDALPPSPLQTEEISQFHCDLAYKVQKDLEEAILYMARHLRCITGATDFALAGGVALNCVANMRVAREAGFKRVYAPPAAGDSGQSMGAALVIWHLINSPASSLSISKPLSQIHSQPHSQRRPVTTRLDGFFGRVYSEGEIEVAIVAASDSLLCRRSDSLVEEVAQYLSQGKIVGWFQGKSEFGPRALGGRSILADARNIELIKKLNQVVKDRMWFQPIAPSVLYDECSCYFESVESPYMTFTSPATGKAKREVPGIVHADGTARVHTVRREDNPLYHQLIVEFRQITSVPIIANTSFNRRGEPIVESPENAVACFMAMPLDILAIGPFLVSRKE